MSFADYVRGKNIILVGPSDGYTGSGKGKEIDSFDVVVRLNWGSPIPEERIQDLGSRTDVLYKRMLTGAQPTGADVEAWLKEKLQWVVTSDRNERTQTYRRFQMLARGRFNIELTRETRATIVREIKNGPLIGVMAIVHLLRQPIKSLTVMNCDFYAGGYHRGYGGQEYRRMMSRPEGVVGAKHNPVLQLAYVHRLRLQDKRLKFDDRLTQLSVDASRSFATHDVMAVIPARWHSGRFPGKPLAPILGKPMVLHVCERVSEVIHNVLVATDDERIAKVVRDKGYSAVIINQALTGTDRVAKAIGGVRASIIVNVQGDEPLVKSSDIADLVEAKRSNPNAVVNGMCLLQGDPHDRSVVKAAVTETGKLLYASRAAIPANKEGHDAGWKQLGLYAYSPKELTQFLEAHQRGLIEETEDVEILRFLELGIPVQMVQLKGTEQAVDFPEHIAIVEAIMRAEQRVPEPPVVDPNRRILTLV